jgi:thiosulfate/3-mercaptopyruvate sulfurtransferase
VEEDAMKRVISIGVVICGVILGWESGWSRDPRDQDAPAKATLLVSASWLAEHLNDADLVIIHVGPKEEYEVGHIPGARLLSTAEVSTPQGSGLRLQLPEEDQLKSALERIGISDNSRVVVYFGKDWVTPATRIFYTLDYAGLGGQTSILNGGLPAWRAENHPVTTDVLFVRPGTFTPRPKRNQVVDAAWVQSNLENSSVSLVDARLPDFYSGANPGTMKRAGRIPGAVNIPFSSLLDDSNRLKDPGSLREIFRNSGIKPGNRVVSYCHIGQQATMVYFVAKYLGYDASLYDGSFEEWSARSDLPVIAGPDASPPPLRR